MIDLEKEDYELQIKELRDEIQERDFTIKSMEKEIEKLKFALSKKG